jgi:hypothetical protein
MFALSNRPIQQPTTRRPDHPTTRPPDDLLTRSIRHSASTPPALARARDDMTQLETNIDSVTSVNPWTLGHVDTLTLSCDVDVEYIPVYVCQSVSRTFVV